jgi:hypothetical protein
MSLILVSELHRENGQLVIELLLRENIHQDIHDTREVPLHLKRAYYILLKSSQKYPYLKYYGKLAYSIHENHL